MSVTISRCSWSDLCEIEEEGKLTETDTDTDKIKQSIYTKGCSVLRKFEKCSEELGIL